MLVHIAAILQQIIIINLGEFRDIDVILHYKTALNDMIILIMAVIMF